MTNASSVSSSNKVSFDVKFRTQMENKIVELLSPKDIDALLAEKCGPEYREYRAKWATGMKFEGVADFPLSLDVENLNHCNFACHHCMFSSKEAHPDTKNRVGKRMMDFALFQKAIDEGSEHKLAAITHGVQCEPMMHPQIIDMISYADKKGIIDQRLGSNGSLLTEEMSERLIDSGLARLEISLDAASAETYKLVRKGKDAVYENVVANIHRFLDIRAKRGTKFPLLRVSIVKMNINKHEVDQFIDYWKGYADYFSLQEPINYQMNLRNTAIEWEQERDKDHFRCDKPYTRVFMRWDGTLHPCFPLNIPGFETFNLGNIKDTTLMEAWTSDHVKHLREIHKAGRYGDNPVCRDCVRRCAVFED